MPGLNTPRHRKAAARLEQGSPDRAEPAAQTPAVEPVIVYADLTKSELKELAAARDLPVSGTKAQLIERLGG